MPKHFERFAVELNFCSFRYFDVEYHFVHWIPDW